MCQNCPPVTAISCEFQIWFVKIQRCVWWITNLGLPEILYSCGWKDPILLVWKPYRSVWFVIFGDNLPGSFVPKRITGFAHPHFFGGFNPWKICLAMGTTIHRGDRIGKIPERNHWNLHESLIYPSQTRNQNLTHGWKISLKWIFWREMSLFHLWFEAFEFRFMTISITPGLWDEAGRLQDLGGECCRGWNYIPSGNDCPISMKNHHVEWVYIHYLYGHFS